MAGRLSAVLLVALGLGAGTAGAQTPDLEAVQRQLDDKSAEAEALSEEASALAGTAGALRAKMVQAAKRARTLEADLNGIEERLGRLRAAEAEALAKLETRREELTGTLAALQRLARRPAAAALATPGSAVDGVRAAMVLRDMVPILETRAATLRREIEIMADLRADMGQELDALAAGQTALDAERATLEGLLDQTEAQRRRTTERQQETQARLRDLADKARDMKALIARLEEARQAPPSPAPRPAARGPQTQTQQPVRLTPPAQAQRTAPFALRPVAAAQGRLTPPVIGRVVTRFGAPTDTGRSQGIRLATRQSGQAVAPYDGVIAFADVFRGYGPLIIIEHADGFHSLIAGLDRLDGMVGQWVVAGEPIGRMSPNDPAPALYYELRRAGEPIDPVPWLAAPGALASG